ncbi:zinc finger CCCH domain-containing protein 13-like isoform X2 [Cimex lectularius]|uniref:C3H1-type domain-containing protein n=1 Tax=Cimex lectularius TaxID=79782 RepID=A0A8I6RVV2_CIMLE|nr:zinc finger CCCH domain-containing protein 13-like isoform X2 [Cimex lectularius]
MSKTSKRKSGESKNNSTNNNNNKEQKRQSVFERLGTKATVNPSPLHLSLSVNTSATGQPQDFCRNWAQNGTCLYGKACKLSNTHILISPSKKNNKKDICELSVSSSLKISSDRRSEEGKRIISTVPRRLGSPELNSWETWDQTVLEYEDEKVLEKRRQLLQRELDLHMKKDTRKESSAKIQRRSSSTSSCSSSSSGSSSSSVSSSESSAVNRHTSDIKKKRRSTSSPSESERNSKKALGKPSMSKDSPLRKSSSSGGSKKIVSPSRKKKKSSSPLPRKLPPPPPSPPKMRSSMSSRRTLPIPQLRNKFERIPEPRPSICARRKESPERRGRGLSSERKKHRSASRSRRRGSSPRPVSRRPRSPDSKLSSSSSSSRQPSSRNRSSDRKKDEDRKSKDDFRRDRKSDYRDKRDLHEDSRSREKAREMREAAREKERSEALERCRERQREREAAAKEKERLREERERERKEAAAKRDRERKDRRASSRDRRRPVSQDASKRHDRVFDRYDRKVSNERERARDRALERVMERKSLERSRDRGRGDSYERPYESSRRLIDDKPYTSPYRSSERRYDADRDRLSPREDRIRGSYSDDRRRESRRDRVSSGAVWSGEGTSGNSSRYEEARDKSTSRGDWEREFQDSNRRDWEPRCRDEGGDDWTSYSGGGGSDWHTSSRSHPMISHHDDRRNHVEVNEKDHSSVETTKDKDSESLIGKRHSRCSGDELDDPPKKSRIDEAPSSLQEELSDISDDADDILNREDVEFTEGDESRLEGDNEQEDHIDESSHSHQPLLTPLTPSDHKYLIKMGMESRMAEDEGMVGLDFEEISDEELEEESKTNKGGSVGDALGVDWTSLMSECKEQNKQNVNEASSAHSYWETNNLLSRIGISPSMAGPKLFSSINEKYPNINTKNKKSNEIAALCRPLSDRKSFRSQLISSAMNHKQALSARADLSIRYLFLFDLLSSNYNRFNFIISRRQLCGLPVVGLETHQNIGFCQWAV